MAALMYWLQEPYDSELSSASFNHSITLSGLHLHESKISFIILKNDAVPNYIGIKFCLYGKPWRGEETTDGGITPGIGYTNTRKPCKGERWSFVPSALRLVGSIITGIIIPACGLVSLSGLDLSRQTELFPLKISTKISCVSNNTECEEWPNKNFSVFFCGAIFEGIEWMPHRGAGWLTVSRWKLAYRWWM
jgi:hypothetical protein